MIDLNDYGFKDLESSSENSLIARVTAVHKERYELVCKYGFIDGKLKASVFYDENTVDYPTVGDFVKVRYNNQGDSFILEVLNRKSKFSRSDFSGHAKNYVKTVKEQVVAANFDDVFIVMSLNKDFNLKRLERYLTLSWQSNAMPVVILTKVDLMPDYENLISEVENIAIGASIFVVSAKTGYGIDELKRYLKKGKTIVLLGSSGVGKSSLVNVLAGEKVMDVNEIREDDQKGRHTTTHRQLILLDNGSMVIDTPGMREIGMWDVEEGLQVAFHDVEVYFGKCKFSDCKHESEPGCAIKEAIKSGELSKERWESYLHIQKEAEFANDKAAFLRKKEKWHKEIAKFSKKRSKNKR